MMSELLEQEADADRKQGWFSMPSRIHRRAACFVENIHQKKTRHLRLGTG